MSVIVKLMNQSVHFFSGLKHFHLYELYQYHGKPLSSHKIYVLEHSHITPYHLLIYRYAIDV
jgi:hypothetical protein